jgi:hypothetical protein
MWPNILCGAAAVAASGAVLGLGLVAMMLMYGNDTILSWMRD